jgi:GR25 family glycosyltransferase involved in LPS biosynthesis
MSDFTIFPAIPGSSLTKQYLRDNLSNDAYYTITTNSRSVAKELNHANSVGCSLSHYSLWQKCIESEKPLLVIEDDVIFNKNGQEKNYNSILDNYLEENPKGLLFLYSLKHAKNPLLFRSTSDWCSRHSKTPECIGTQAYLITPHAAKVLSNHFFPISTHVDYYITLTCMVEKVDLHFVSRKNLYFRTKLANQTSSNLLLYRMPRKQRENIKKYVIMSILCCSHHIAAQRFRSVHNVMVKMLPPLLVTLVSMTLAPSLNKWRLSHSR